MTPALPSVVIERLSGLPVHGRSEAAIPLLTRDAEGFPHVCLLSRAQLDAAPPDVVVAVVTSRQTRQNLVERPLATLLVVGDVAAYYCKLAVTETIDDGWALGARLRLRRLKTDPVPGGLTPIGYLPTPEHEHAERWSPAADLLRRLLAGPTPSGTRPETLT